MQLQKEVVIDAATHRYTHVVTQREYISVSKFLEYFDEKVDWEGIARNCAGKGKYKGMTQAMILKAWDENRDKAAKHGTNIHAALESYSKYCKINPEHESMRPMIESINSEKTEYIRKYQEVILYIDFKDKSGKYAGLAGTVDEILLVNKNGLVVVEDFKTNLTGIKYFNEKNHYMKFPLTHLQSCNYNKYCLQLSAYSFMYELMTGGSIRQLQIRFIPSDNFLNHYKIPVPYMKDCIISMIDTFEKVYNGVVDEVCEIE